jgi:hypothetical protein
MSCQTMTSLGVYVLGAAEPAERRRIEAHLAWCPSCRAELIRLAPIPGLLASVPPSAVPSAAAVRSQPPGHAGSPPDRPLRLSRPGQPRPAQPSAGQPRPTPLTGRAKLAGIVTGLAACVAVALAVVVGAAGPPGPNGHPPVTLSGMNPVTHVRVTAALAPASWGTRIRLTIRGAPLNVRCRLVVRSRAGGTETTGVWDAWSEGPITVPASAAWRPSDIANLKVMAGSRTLVTINAGRTGSAHTSAAGRR